MARLILAILIIGVLVAIAAVATGFIDVSTRGQFKAPSVNVSAGELPSVDIATKKVVIESTNQAVEVPDITTTTTNVEVPVVRTEDQ